MEFLQSTTRRVTFEAYLASDHLTPATGKTIAITIAKNGANTFSNPNAGATNATEMLQGSYYVDLDTTDTGTLGPLVIRGVNADIDDVKIHRQVVKSTNRGMTGIPDAAVNANGGLPVLSNSGTTLAYTVSTLTTYTGNTVQTGDSYAKVNDGAIGLAAIKGYVDDIGIAGAGLTSIPTIARVTLVDTTTANTDMRGTDNALPASNYTAPLSAAGTRSAVGLAAANLDTQLATIAGYIDTEIATLITSIGSGLNALVTAVKAKTDNLPVSPAAVGSAMTLDLSQAITPTTITDTVGGALAAARAQGFGKWVLDKVAKTLTLYAADETTVVRTFTLDDGDNPTQRV